MFILSPYKGSIYRIWFEMDDILSPYRALLKVGARYTILTNNSIPIYQLYHLRRTNSISRVYSIPMQGCIDKNTGCYQKTRNYIPIKGFAIFNSFACNLFFLSLYKGSTVVDVTINKQLLILSPYRGSTVIINEFIII